MPDITMCLNTDCPSREACYRFVAKPSDRQAVDWFSPEKGKPKCNKFWFIGCDHVKKEGESCLLNNNCKFPNCESN